MHQSTQKKITVRSILEENSHLKQLINPPEFQFLNQTLAEAEINLIRLDEINEEEHQAYRQSLANVFATLEAKEKVRLIYVLDGSASGVSLYYGLAKDKGAAVDLHDAMGDLRSALEGQLAGINFGKKHINTQAFMQRINAMPHQGVVLGAPSIATENTNEEQDFQSIDRIARAMHNDQYDGQWQMLVVSEPLARSEIREQLDTAYVLSSQLSALVKTSLQTGTNESQQKSASHGTNESQGANKGTSYSKGKNEGANEGKSWGTNESSSRNASSSSNSDGSNTGGSQGKNWGTNEGTSTNQGESSTKGTSENYSLSDTTGSSLNVGQELANKRAQHLMEYLDKQLIDRLKLGLTKGLYHSAVYLTASNTATYKRLKNTLRATLQGNQATLSPLEVYDLPKEVQGKLFNLPSIQTKLTDEEMLFHSLKLNASKHFGSLLTADELAVVAGLPENEVQGVRRKKTVNFIVDLPDTDKDNSVRIGCIMNKGREYTNNHVHLSKKDLNKHTFVTGVTGSGKTTTCLQLLLDSHMPFLVIEPAKTEYRELSDRIDGVQIFRPNGDIHQSLRINPFAFMRKDQQVKSHAGFLKNVFTTIFPMEASMPMMVEAAILASYEEKGWDIDESEFLLADDPFDPLVRAWPTMSDMIRQLDEIIPKYKLGKEFEEKYRGSLVSRLRSLTDGTLGRVLDVPQSIDFHDLLNQRVVIELEELQGGEEKALLMALLLGNINEAIRARHAKEKDFLHLTLVEEAHRLLSKPEPGDKAGAMAVEAFADMLAEVRKYGEGLIIADQIPAKLIPDVIKNTHTKIVHRLFAEDDRRAMGETMMMNEDQRTFLPNLGTGEAAVFCGGWHGPAHTKIRNDLAQTDNTNQVDINQYGVSQLWHNRLRYYPQFCSLNWLSTNQDSPDAFAHFIRETKQAQNQLLRLVREKDKTSTISLSTFKLLKSWFEKWKPISEQVAAQINQQLLDNPELWPQSLLAAAWWALLLDAVSRPSPENDKLLPIYMGTAKEKKLYIKLTDVLIDGFIVFETPADYFQSVVDDDNTLIKKTNGMILSDLSKYKTI